MKTIFVFTICIIAAFWLNGEVQAGIKGRFQIAQRLADAHDFFRALNECKQAGAAATQEDSRAEALYLFGRIAEQAGAFYTGKLNSVQDADYSREMQKVLDEMKPLEDLSVRFYFSHLGQTFEYSGDSYKVLEELFPHSSWAVPASFRLYLLRIHRGEVSWEGSTEPVLLGINNLKRLLAGCTIPVVRNEILLSLAEHYYSLICTHGQRGPQKDVGKAMVMSQEMDRVLAQIDQSMLDKDQASTLGWLRAGLTRAKTEWLGESPVKK